MANIAKYIIAGISWALFGPIGGLIGFAVGSLLSSDKQEKPREEPKPSHGPYHNTGTQQDIHVALMVLIAAVMKADGVVKRSELDKVKQFLLANYGEEQGKEMLHIIRQLVDQVINIEQVCAQIKVNTD